MLNTFRLKSHLKQRSYVACKDQTRRPRILMLCLYYIWWAILVTMPGFHIKNHIEKMGQTHCEDVEWRDLCQSQGTTAVDKSLKALVISSIKRMRMIDSAGASAGQVCVCVCVCVCPLPWRRSCICPREQPPRLSATGAAGWTLARKRLSFAGNSAVAYSSLNLLLQTDRQTDGDVSDRHLIICSTDDWKIQNYWKKSNNKQRLFHRHSIKTSEVNTSTSIVLRYHIERLLETVKTPKIFSIYLILNCGQLMIFNNVGNQKVDGSHWLA